MKTSHNTRMELMPIAVPAPNGSNLCLECALCCDGSIFPMAQLRPQEMDLARTLGLAINETGERPAFDLPCHLLHGTACSIYAKGRPEVCGAFRCELLKKYLAGGVDLATAVQTVHTARGLLIDMQAHLPFGIETRVTFRVIRLMVAYIETLSEEDRTAHASFLEAAAKYLRLIGGVFLKLEEPAQPSTTDQSINLVMAPTG